MNFKAVYLKHSRFVVNKNEKLKKKKKKKKKKFSSKVLIFFLFIHENICCGYSLEAPCFHGEIRKILSGYPSY